MSLSRNDVVTSTWTSKTFNKLSNPNAEMTIEYWVGTVAPTATNFGHPLTPLQGLNRADFEDADTIWFRYIGAGTCNITITE